MEGRSTERIIIESVQPGQWFRFYGDQRPCLAIDPPDGRPRPWFKWEGTGQPRICDAANTRVVPIPDVTDEQIRAAVEEQRRRKSLDLVGTTAVGVLAGWARDEVERRVRLWAELRGQPMPLLNIHHKPCCDHARQKPCLCGDSRFCPIHGEACFGSHA